MYTYITFLVFIIAIKQIFFHTDKLILTSEFIHPLCIGRVSYQHFFTYITYTMIVFHDTIHIWDFVPWGPMQTILTCWPILNVETNNNIPTYCPALCFIESSQELYRNLTPSRWIWKQILLARQLSIQSCSTLVMFALFFFNLIKGVSRLYLSNEE